MCHVETDDAFGLQRVGRGGNAPWNCSGLCETKQEAVWSQIQDRQEGQRFSFAGAGILAFRNLPTFLHSLPLGRDSTPTYHPSTCSSAACIQGRVSNGEQCFGCNSIKTCSSAHTAQWSSAEALATGRCPLCSNHRRTGCSPKCKELWYGAHRGKRRCHNAPSQGNGAQPDWSTNLAHHHLSWDLHRCIGCEEETCKQHT